MGNMVTAYLDTASTNNCPGNSPKGTQRKAHGKKWKLGLLRWSTGSTIGQVWVVGSSGSRPKR